MVTRLGTRTRNWRQDVRQDGGHSTRILNADKGMSKRVNTNFTFTASNGRITGAANDFTPSDAPMHEVVELSRFTANPFGSGLIGYYDIYVRDSDKAAFIATQQRGSLLRFDMSDPTKIAYVGESARHASGKGNRVISVLDSTHLVVSNDQNAVIIYDISGGGAPTQSGILQDNTNLKSCLSVRVVGTNGFAACSGTAGAGLLTSLDLSGANPVRTSTLTDAAHIATPVNLEIAGNYAVIASNSATLGSISTFDITNPASMSFIDTQPCKIASGLFVDGNTIYVTSYDVNGAFPSKAHVLYVFTINPSTGALTLANTITGVPTANKMIKVGNFLWGQGAIGDFTSGPPFEISGLFAFDVTVATSPKLVYVGPQTLSEARLLFNIGNRNILYGGADTGAELYIWRTTKFAIGDPVFVSGTQSNNGYFEVTGLSDDGSYLVLDPPPKDEGPVSSIIRTP